MITFVIVNRIDFCLFLFQQDEPMNTYLNLGECKELEEFSVKCLPDKCSFKAINSSGEIVGVFLNGIVEKPVSNHVLQKNQFGIATVSS